MAASKLTYPQQKTNSHAAITPSPINSSDSQSAFTRKVFAPKLGEALGLEHVTSRLGTLIVKKSDAPAAVLALTETLSQS